LNSFKDNPSGINKLIIAILAGVILILSLFLIIFNTPLKNILFYKKSAKEIATEAEIEETAEKLLESKRETDQAVSNFLFTYYSYLGKVKETGNLWNEYSKYINDINNIVTERTGLTIKDRDKLGKLGREGLDIVNEIKKILDDTRDLFMKKAV